MCDACDRAKSHPLTGRFNAGCDGCAARALARAPEFAEAAKQGKFTPRYRMALSQMFPKLPNVDAHALVRSWAK